MQKINNAKGFTLIELLVVLAIVAVLSVVVILTLNPAELLRQSRDSNRLSDLATMKSAISLYLVDVSLPSIGNPANCYVSFATTTLGCGIFTVGTATSSSAANNRKVDGSGWIPVNFTSISSGAPLGNLPIDPANNSTYYYAYVTSGNLTLTFEIDAFLESTKYRGNMTSDGGSNNGVYEVGTSPGLALNDFVE